MCETSAEKNGQEIVRVVNHTWTAVAYSKTAVEKKRLASRS